MPSRSDPPMRAVRRLSVVCTDGRVVAIRGLGGEMRIALVVTYAIIAAIAVGALGKGALTVIGLSLSGATLVIVGMLRTALAAGPFRKEISAKTAPTAPVESPETGYREAPPKQRRRGDVVIEASEARRVSVETLSGRKRQPYAVLIEVASGAVRLEGFSDPRSANAIAGAIAKDTGLDAPTPLSIDERSGCLGGIAALGLLLFDVGAFVIIGPVFCMSRASSLVPLSYEPIYAAMMLVTGDAIIQAAIGALDRRNRGVGVLRD